MRVEEDRESKSRIVMILIEILSHSKDGRILSGLLSQ